MFNLDLGDPKTVWLNITNIALGAVTLLCFVMVGYGAVRELAVRLSRRWNLGLQADDHVFLVPGLGTTMADGGEKVDDESERQGPTHVTTPSGGRVLS